MNDLLDGMVERNEALAPGASILRGFARAELPSLIAALARITEAAPFRHMTTRGGHSMSVDMTSCGAVGWVTDGTGYHTAPGRSTESDPVDLAGTRSDAGSQTEALIAPGTTAFGAPGVRRRQSRIQS